MSDWKQEHANESEKAFLHPIAQDVINEFKDNLTHNSNVRPGSAMFDYGLSKVCTYVAQIARAQALGFDPALLRGTPEESNEHMTKLAEMAVRAGKPVFIVEGEAQTTTG